MLQQCRSHRAVMIERTLHRSASLLASEFATGEIPCSEQGRGLRRPWGLRASRRLRDHPLASRHDTHRRLHRHRRRHRRRRNRFLPGAAPEGAARRAGDAAGLSFDRPLGRALHGELRHAAGARPHPGQPRLLRVAARGLQRASGARRARRHDGREPRPGGAPARALGGAAADLAARPPARCGGRVHAPARAASRPGDRRRLRARRVRPGRERHPPGVPARHPPRRRRRADRCAGVRVASRGGRVAGAGRRARARGAARCERGGRLGRRRRRARRRPTDRPRAAPPLGLHLRAARRRGERRLAHDGRRGGRLVHQARRRHAARLAGQRRAGSAARRAARRARHRHRDRPHRAHDDTRRSAGRRAPGPACAPSSPTATWSAAPTPSCPASSGRPGRAATASRPRRRWASRWRRSCAASRFPRMSLPSA